MSLNILLRWPDELVCQLNELEGTDKIAGLWRCDNYRDAELLLLPRLAGNKDDFNSLVLLSLCSLSLQRERQHSFVLQKLVNRFPAHELTRWIQMRHWLLKMDAESVASAGDSIWDGEHHSQLLTVLRCRFLLASNQLEELQSKLKSLDPVLTSTLEIQQCKGDLAAVLGDPIKALEIWKPLVDRCPCSRSVLSRVIKLGITCRDSETVIRGARLALDRFGENAEFLNSITTIKLYQRQPGLAQRSLLLAMVWRSLGFADVDISNLFSCYEMNGLVDWLEHVVPSAVESPINQQTTFSNRSMQLASITSSKYQHHVQSYVSALRTSESNSVYRNCSKLKQSVTPGSRLKVAWVMGDLAPHPVSRFVYQFFAGSQNSDLVHEHVLVNTFDYGKESCKKWFQDISNISIVDVSFFQAEKRVAAIRDLGADIAIDLSGWTSNHFLAGFLARLAPVQVNYLGYFASSGLNEMDYWLGDHYLFPTPMLEWSSENIVRLDRPFLAWKPVPPLPEADALVAEAPSGPIRFGSFNHNRKMSDQTITLWGKILQAVPDSILVLKANASEDVHTKRILRNRMIAHGLDPHRIEWLPLTRTPLEHLQQYSKLDVALDPFPNGGCTTTCESLWMGVPVITLKGSHYVSRMSTAVLAGAQMHEWIADSVADYLSIALKCAQELGSLRSNRQKWRNQLQLSPLGDPMGLMHALEDKFSTMAMQSRL